MSIHDGPGLEIQGPSCQQSSRVWSDLILDFIMDSVPCLLVGCFCLGALGPFPIRVTGYRFLWRNHFAVRIEQDSESTWLQGKELSIILSSLRKKSANYLDCWICTENFWSKPSKDGYCYLTVDKDVQYCTLASFHVTLYCLWTQYLIPVTSRTTINSFLHACIVWCRNAKIWWDVLLFGVVVVQVMLIRGTKIYAVEICLPNCIEIQAIQNYLSSLSHHIQRCELLKLSTHLHHHIV